MVLTGNDGAFVEMMERWVVWGGLGGQIRMMMLMALLTKKDKMKEGAMKEGVMKMNGRLTDIWREVLVWEVYPSRKMYYIHVR
jgi:hypothetical protein